MPSEDSSQERSFGMRRIEAMPHVICPQCKARIPINSKTAAEIILPFLTLFQRRVCGNCGYRWTPFGRWKFEWFYGGGMAWRAFSLIGLMAAIISTLFLIFTNSSGPLEKVREIIRVKYEKIHQAGKVQDSHQQ